MKQAFLWKDSHLNKNINLGKTNAKLKLGLLLCGSRYPADSGLKSPHFCLIWISHRVRLL